MKIQSLVRRAGHTLAVCALASSALAQAQSLAVLKGSQGCPMGSEEKYIYIDNENSSNANTSSGWLGATVVTENTDFRFCSVNANFFPTLERDYALLSLDGTCPIGTIRFRRIIDANNNFLATASTSRTDIPGVLIPADNNPAPDVKMTFCRFPGAGSIAWNNPFPDLGVDYGVFAPSDFRYAKQTGRVYMDDEDSAATGGNLNRWCTESDYCTSGNQNLYNIMDGGLNTAMKLALVRQCGNGGNQVPPLSGASGSVTRSGAYSSDYEAWKAFDADTASMWISAVYQTPAWIAFNFSGPRQVARYAITFSNGSLTSRAPRSWTLQGWNGSSWVNVDSRSNQTNWLGVERREYAVSSPGDYSQYRLNVTDDNDGAAGIAVISIARLELFAPTGCN